MTDRAVSRSLANRLLRLGRAGELQAPGHGVLDPHRARRGARLRHKLTEQVLLHHASLGGVRLETVPIKASRSPDHLELVEDGDEAVEVEGVEDGHGGAGAVLVQLVDGGTVVAVHVEGGHYVLQGRHQGGLGKETGNLSILFGDCLPAGLAGPH